METQCCTITQRIVEAAKIPAAGQRFIRDDKIGGFALRVTEGGAKSFVIEGRVKGRFRRFTFGTYPAMTVAKARIKAIEVKAGFARGEDPSAERRMERAAPTFRDLTDAYIERHAKPHKKSWARDRARIAQHFKSLMRWQLSEITTAALVKLQNKIAAEHGEVESNRAMELIRAMFNVAVDWELYDGRNPAERIKRFQETRRERFLSEIELRAVNAALMDEKDWRWRGFFPLALFLGLRRSELAGAQWEQINLEARTLTVPHTKSGRPHILPLPAPAIEIIEHLESRDKSEFLFPSRGRTGHITEIKSAWARIWAAAKVYLVKWAAADGHKLDPESIERATPHDLRRTLGSWLAAQGISLPIIGRALNHTTAAATSIYARLAMDPVREALERNASLMLGHTAAEPNANR